MKRIPIILLCLSAGPATAQESVSLTMELAQGQTVIVGTSSVETTITAPAETFGQVQRDIGDSVLVVDGSNAQPVVTVENTITIVTPPPTEPISVTAPVNPPPAPQIFNDIHFAFNRAEILPESQADLARMAQVLQAYPREKAMIVGHTDSIGSRAFNRALSIRRSQAVRRVLIRDYGIDPSRLSSSGEGEDRPVASNSTDEGRALNRRVELQFLS